ncbi:uncharacterized protein LOC129322447 [Prosopis cineraria]|uniref:uncharacterized protein LOC129322447 n=1 Tax=Prosopis cineraria TaxID=364024 RepID=UPI0024109E86|nr:uncharacterized protein LOC129322447 [Prosopis cineraria]
MAEVFARTNIGADLRPSLAMPVSNSLIVSSSPRRARSRSLISVLSRSRVSVSARPPQPTNPNLTPSVKTDESLSQSQSKSRVLDSQSLNLSSISHSPTIALDCLCVLHYSTPVRALKDPDLPLGCLSSHFCSQPVSFLVLASCSQTSLSPPGLFSACSSQPHTLPVQIFWISSPFTVVLGRSPLVTVEVSKPSSSDSVAACM